MRKIHQRIPFSPLPLALGVVGVLMISYIGLIAAIMSYGALTIEFSQSVKNDEASVATLETQYLAAIATITSSSYVAEGYVMPSSEIYVESKGETALR
jgi:amino acid permease